MSSCRATNAKARARLGEPDIRAWFERREMARSRDGFMWGTAHNVIVTTSARHDGLVQGVAYMTLLQLADAEAKGELQAMPRDAALAVVVRDALEMIAYPWRAEERAKRERAPRGARGGLVLE